LTGPLQAVAEFLRIDSDLIAAAAEGSPQRKASIPQDELKRWILSLCDAEKTKMLLDVALRGSNAQAELLKAFRDTQNRGRGRAGKARTVAQLLAQAGKRAEERRRPLDVAR